MRTMVVAPHADDELLGCGGTLLKRKSEGNKLAWIIVTSISEEAGFSKERVEKRKYEIDYISKEIGFEKVYNLNFQPTSLGALNISIIINALRKAVEDFKPHELFVPHYSDVHSDHRTTFEACACFSKWFRYPYINKVLAYETISETDFGINHSTNFIPNYYINISNSINKKIELLSVYEGEIHPFPFPRSVEAIQAQSTLRGAASGYSAAEAFQILKNREN